MAEIIDIRAHRKTEPPSIDDLIARATDVVLSEWRESAKNNRLSEYVTSSLGPWAISGTNYLNSLDAVVKVEQRLNMAIIVRSPHGTNIGWRAIFMLEGMEVWSPEMPFEHYARCFNLLLFIYLRHLQNQHVTSSQP